MGLLIQRTGPATTKELVFGVASHKYRGDGLCDATPNTSSFVENIFELCIAFFCEFQVHESTHSFDNEVSLHAEMLSPVVVTAQPAG